ncbi:MAG TPA: 4Fe-4S dicluster domain-containing protein [Gemmatimonadaceae bacterium]|jgi:molybdopterin-containing oxidoreductase family iron-sulfur binding subunit
MPDADNSKTAGVRRREFLKVLGASGAVAAAVGCAPEDVGKLIPYVVSPDDTVPGVSTYYATTCRECSAACGVIAETRDGRAIKLEGNPEHPLNRGGLCARGQAALQGLYNPDRFRGPMIKQGNTWKPAQWEDALNLVSQHLTSARGAAANAVFINQHETGSFPAFLDQWLAAYGMRPHLSIDLEADHAAIDANHRAYNIAWPRLNFADAKFILSIGADFLEGWGASVPQQLDFADARAKLENAPRFVYVGPRRSLTGLNADQWIPCAPGAELAIVNFLADRGAAPPQDQTGVAPAVLEQLRTELTSAKPSIVLSGVTTDNAGDVAATVAALNQSLGNVGTTIRAADPIVAFDGMATPAELLDAVERMRAGQVPIVFVRGVNPAHGLPKSLNFADAFGKVPFRVSFSSYPDETTELCDVVLPDFHSLESWGDAQPVRATIGLQQPTMDPVFANTRATGDVLIALAKKDQAAAPRLTMKDYRSWLFGRLPGGEQAVTAALTRGVMAGNLAPRPAAATTVTPRRVPTLSTTTGDYFLVVYPSPALGHGRGTNKPWLVELPDPVTKITWGSWVELHPETAARLGIDRGDIVEIRAGSGTVRAPAVPYLGVRPDVVAIATGYGHRAATSLPMYDNKHRSENPLQWGYGRYARDLGVNALDLLPAGTNGAGGLTLTATKVTISRVGDQVKLASTEGSARQHGRGIAQAVNAEDLARGIREPGEKEEAIEGDASHAFLPGLRSPVAADAQGILGAPTDPNQGKNKGLYDPTHPTHMASRRWAMTVDLARCTGCSACVTACYAENNIPTVGAPWQNATLFASPTPGFNITRGREMAWIRLERYFEGNPDGRFGEEFETRFVPMMCQHCGNAPCEPVCPVYATYHSPDGLNVQVYNRCVGTRYCSNNCPYKVRYFNWFGYGEPDRKQFAFPEPLNWQLNPDVTVRGKGVMEKCSFCVQRIREAENRAALEHRELVPDEFTTACAAACPSRAITFGDAADPQWTVAQLAQDRRAYHVFEELNTFTAVVYLKKVTHIAGPTAQPSPPATR